MEPTGVNIGEIGVKGNLSEMTRPIKNRFSRILPALSLLLGMGSDLLLQSEAFALPVGGTVSAGSASIQQTGSNSLDIVQQSDKAIIDWKKFNIDAGELTHFQQPSATSIILNRVTGGDLSQIYGTLTSNGVVVLANPQGIMFQKGSLVNVGGLIATAAQTNDADFMAGRYAFQTTSSASNAAIINQGSLMAADGGVIALVAPQVENSGLVRANLGSVALSSGQAFTIDFHGDQLLRFAVPQGGASAPQGHPVVQNSGRIEANGGRVWLTASAAEAAVNGVVSLGGVVEARTVAFKNGEIILDGGSGSVSVSGVADASGQSDGQKGGTINTLGDRITLTDSARLDVSGPGGGGVVLVGGDRHGANPDIANATTVTVQKGARITADAGVQGDGGEIVVWADGRTDFQGSASAQGGRSGGRGGFVEISGKQQLHFQGTVNTLAPQGESGTLLLDPTNIVVATATADATPGQVDQFADANVNGATQTSTVSPAALDGQATNIMLQATHNITFTDAVNLTTASVGLTAQAGNNIAVNNTITTQGGAVTLSANNGGGPASGTGSVTINAGITTNGGNFASIGVGFDGTGSTISTNTGTITLTHTGSVVLGAISTDNALNVTANGPLTQSGSLLVRATSLSVGSGNNITLNDSNNNFYGTLAISSGKDVILKDKDNLVLGAVNIAGNLSVTALNGSITQSGGGLTVPGTTTLLASGSNNGITLDRTDNVLTGAVTITNGGDVVLTNTIGLAFGSINMTGNLTATTANGNMTQSGAVVIPGSTTLTSSGAGKYIKLDNTLNDFSDTVTATTNGGDITLFDKNLIKLGTMTASNLTVTAASGGITQVGNGLTVSGSTVLSASGNSNSITLDNTNNDFSGAIAIGDGGDVTLVDKNHVVLGTTAITGSLTVTAINGSITQSGGGLTVHGSTTLSASGAANGITLDNNNNNFTGAVTISHGGDVALTDINDIILGTTTISGSLSVTAINGGITQSGSGLTVPGTTTLSASGTGNGITLNNNNNDFTGAVTISHGGDVVLTDKNDMVLGTTTISGGLSVTTINGGITQSGNGLTVPGAVTLAAFGPSNGITLDNNNNDFSSAVTISSGGNVALKDKNDIILGTMVMSGRLSVTAINGSITQNGLGLTVPGTTTLSASGAANSIVLDNNGNDFSGAVLIGSGGDVALKDKNHILLGTTTISGRLSVTAVDGSIVQNGGLTVPGTMTLSASGSVNSIVLDRTDNTFSSPITVTTGGNVSLTNTTDLTLGSVNMSGNLALVSGAGNITQNVAIVVPGSTTLTTLGSGKYIKLDNALNDFSDTVTATTNGGDVTLFDKNRITLGTIAANNLTVTAASGDISQVGGGLTVSGLTVLSASGHGNGITLDNANNDFSGAIAIGDGGDVALADKNHIILGTITISGSLVVTATNGSITQSGGGLAVPGGTTLSASGAANGITLDNNNNDFSGAVTISHGGDVALTDKNDIVLGTTTISGHLLVTASNGGITQIGNGLTVPGITILSASGTGINGITLNSTGNDFSDSVSIGHGGDVTLTDKNHIILGTTTISGSLSVTTINGGITQTGNGLTVPGTTTLSASGTGNGITLNNNNDFSGAVTVVHGGDVGLTDINNILLGTVSISGSLSVTALNGGITQSGDGLRVPGTTTLSASGPNNDIVLDNTGNDFSGSVTTVRGGNVTLTDKNDILLGATTISGRLLVKTLGGGITQSGALDISGDTILGAGGTNGNIVLSPLGNHFLGAINFSGHDIDLKEAITTVNGKGITMTNTGTLTVWNKITSGGAFTQTGVGNVLLKDDISTNKAAITFQTGLSCVSVSGGCVEWAVPLRHPWPQSTSRPSVFLTSTTRWQRVWRKG